MRTARWIFCFAPVGLLLAAARPVAAAIPPLSLIAEFTGADAGFHPNFGQSVALDVDVGIAGAPSLTGGEVGAAYVYTRTPSDSWTPAQQLLGSGQRELFGTSVAVSGDTILVSAPNNGASPNVTAAGAVYVFVRSGETWTQQQLLQYDINDPSVLRFGTGVAIAGNTAFVAELASSGVGDVYVFSRSGTTWSLVQKLVPSGGSNQLRPLAVSGNTLLVGAIDEDAAYFFVETGGLWTETQRVSSSDPFFGQSVALSGDTALVGAQERVHVLQRSSGGWSDQAPLVGANPNTDAGIDFGAAVAINENASAVLVSAPLASKGAGTVYVFGPTADGWTQQQAIRGTANFGNSLAFSGTTALIGTQSGVGDAFFFAPLFTSVPATGQGAVVLAGILFLGGLRVAGQRARNPARSGFPS